jgi:hypothetical protein
MVRGRRIYGIGIVYSGVLGAAGGVYSLRCFRNDELPNQNRWSLEEPRASTAIERFSSVDDGFLAPCPARKKLEG